MYLLIYSFINLAEFRGVETREGLQEITDSDEAKGCSTELVESFKLAKEKSLKQLKMDLEYFVPKNSAVEMKCDEESIKKFFNEETGEWTIDFDESEIFSMVRIQKV